MASATTAGMVEPAASTVNAPGEVELGKLWSCVSHICACSIKLTILLSRLRLLICGVVTENGRGGSLREDWVISALLVLQDAFSRLQGRLGKVRGIFASLFRTFAGI